ncbi:helix-turn-helix transcriptional regulator [Frankia sp. AgB32]|uniref:helix-turn-helix domain-containing protein n=1 Tax=Frankia sp. AgB32 TaxID=631119 RepID=UPI00200CAB18|nr:helix-turn-helix transcriptional regulator [Frankia sp. AgB32]MCK9896954.1 helix-turn-helix domain-containing protein [Frankia sp. AgB32]
MRGEGQEIGQTADRVIERLRAIRTARGISQAGLAAQVGMARSVLSTAETGGRARGLTLVEALALCAALDVDLARLLDPAPYEVPTGTITV